MTSSYDYIIVGAGPAGLQLGYFLAKQQRQYLILESGGEPGSFFKTFPRHDTLLSINKVHTGYDDPEVNLRWDWNALLCDEEMPFKTVSKSYFPSKSDLVRYLGDFAARFQLNIQYGVTIRSIQKGDGFELQDAQGHIYRCQRLIMATGVSKPYIPAIPGIEHAELYTDVSVCPDDFVDQRVLIIGKGNSAFETAENLIETASLIHLASPNSITMAWQSHFVGHLRAVNNNFLDTYHLKAQNAILDAAIEQIEMDAGHYEVTVRYEHASGEVECLHYDRVIVCTGFQFDASLFDATCRPQLTMNNRLPDQTSEWESTNVPGLFFAGVLMQVRDYQQTASAFIHGFRYNVRALARILDCKYHDQPWSARPLEPTPTDLTEYILSRVNTSSGLWQQFGFLGDLIVVSETGDVMYGYEDIPVDYIHDTELGQHQHYYIVTLEYGADHDNQDPFRLDRVHRDDHDQAHESRFLHPIVRRFDGDTLQSEHHIIEDLYGVWQEACHIEPLSAYLESQFAAIAQMRIAVAS